ncbi:hypothetical protein CHELA20_50448 [Hyphomicrobiales bacterium]|nr:hypothetical protein CHELA20_50448 [Hyphomicrobiales bacterium]CAH1679427.1 hypothetical protein CHELA41_24678 [Hyphomicrobiales bacterium]
MRPASEVEWGHAAGDRAPLASTRRLLPVGQSQVEPHPAPAAPPSPEGRDRPIATDVMTPWEERINRSRVLYDWALREAGPL